VTKKNVDREWKNLQNYLSLKPAIEDIEKSLNQYLLFLLSSVILNMIVKEKKDSELIIEQWMESFKKNFEHKIETDITTSYNVLTNNSSEFPDLRDIKSLYYLALNCVVDDGKQALLKLISNTTEDLASSDNHFASAIKEKTSPLQ